MGKRIKAHGDGMTAVAAEKGTDARHRQSQRILFSLAAMSGLVGMSLATYNAYLGETGFLKPARAAYRSNVRPQLMANKGVMLTTGVPKMEITPDIVRAILNMPEQQQMALVLPASSAEEAARQQVMIQKAMAGIRKKQLLKHDAPHEPEAPPESAEGGHAASLEDHVALEEEEGEHTLTPSQVRTERLWALIFVTGIVTASVVFETVKEIIEHNSPDSMQPVVNKFFSELATLGFIGTIAFVLTTGFNGHDSVMGHLSFWFTGDQELLIHEFEILHFLIFFVMVFFITSVLIILQIAVNQKLVWAQYEEHLLRVVKSVQSVEDRTLEIVRLLHIDPKKAALEGTVTAEYAKPKVVRQAEFMRFRHRFIQDADCQVTIPPDFAFAEYLTKKIAKVLAHVVEITVVDWSVLWFVFLLLFFLMVVAQYIYPPMREGDMPVYIICAGYGLLQVTVVVVAVLGFRALAYIRSMLVPQLALSELEQGAPDLATFVVPPRYESEMKLVVKDTSMMESVMGVFVDMRKPSKHEQLFGAFGAIGPKVFMHFIKLVLLLSVVSIATVCVVLFKPLWEISVFLPFLALLPSIVCIFLTPRMVILYTWCCSTEMLKDLDLVMDVLRGQKQEKLLNILRILSMLSFFLEQVEFLKKMAQDMDDGRVPSDDEKKGIADEQWKALIDKTDPKVVEDLEALFVAYDDDDSGELDEGEVRELVEQLGMTLTDQEARNLFKVMDADGGGSVDFKEFATVILHQQNQRSGNVDYAKLADKMFDIFDKDKTGQIDQDEVLEQMQRMGKNWDHAGIQFFFQQIDKDGSGVIEKPEFVDYISKVQAEISGV